MSAEERIKATAKNIEGKVQEAVGDLTGDPQTQAEGKAKQMEAQVRHTVESVKDRVNEDNLMSAEERIKATAKNIEGKVQEAVGDLTGDPQTQAEGKAKQMEAQVRHTVEDVKDEVRNNTNY